MLISIVIPMYNEEKRIGKTLWSVKNQTEKWPDKIELVLVDDGSNDKTITVVEAEMKKIDMKYKLVKSSQNQGKGAAVRKGVKAAQGETIIIFDADNSTTIDTYEKLKEFLIDYDIIIGSRHLTDSHITIKQTFLRRLISRAGNVFIRLLLGLPYKDTQCGFKIIKSDIAKKVMDKLTIERWGFDIEMLVIARENKYKIIELPVKWSDASDSKLRAAQAFFQTLREVLKIYRNKISGLYS